MPSDATATYAIQLNTSLERARSGIEDEIQDLNRLVVPGLDVDQIRNATGLQSDTTPAFRDDLHETTALEVHKTLVNGLMAHLTPIGSQWCSIISEDDTQASADAKHWLHYAGQSLLRLLSPSSSNFYTALARTYFMDGGFGTSVIIPRLSSKNSLVFDSLPIMTYCLGLDADDNPATLTRTYTLAASQILEMFGPDCPGHIAKQAASPEEKTKTHRILHLIEPNLQRDPRKQDSKNLPFRILFVDVETETTIREEGAFEQPHAVSTWAPSMVGPYGVSPFSEVLPDIRQLQNLALNRSILVERAGSPPWFIPAGYDGKFDPRPHGHNIPGQRGTPDELMPREMPVTGRLDYLQAEAADKEARIKSAGFYDLFRLLTTSIDQQKTAYEVRELMGEKATLFHPFYARKTQQLTQVIRRTIAIAIRAGLIAPPPRELLQPLPDGRMAMADPEVHYNSKLARALELNESNALLGTIDALAPLAGQDGINSPVFDWLDIAAAGPHLARTYGVSHSVMASPNAITAKAKARADAAKQAADLQAAQAATQGVHDLGGVDAAQQAAKSLGIS